MKKLVISSHNLRSNALKALQQELSERVGYYVYRVKPDRVRHRIAVHFDKGLDKITQYKKFKEGKVSSPAYATSFEDATELPSKNVVLRKLINSSEGKGIEIVEREQLDEEQHRAPLYTEYIPKKKEFRVHVYNSRVIMVQEKKKKKGIETDAKVRNTSNGYIFSRNIEFIPDDLSSCAIAAVQSLDRTQGAVDIIYNEKRNKCYALEVNARPGMVNTTCSKWANAILENKDIKRAL